MKNPIKKLRKKTKLKSEVLRKKCVNLAKLIVKEIAGWECEYCHKRKGQVAIHAHHIYNEGIHRSMSADTDNLIVVCFTHHLGGWNAKEPSFHRNPQEMADWFREKYPERAKQLRERARLNQQADEKFWEDKLKKLKEIYKKLCQKNEQSNPF